MNSDLIILPASDSPLKVPEYSSQILGSIFNLFSLQCITQCQMHNRLSINISWKWKGGKRREEIKRRKIRGREGNWGRMNQLLYARISREEPAPPQGKSRRSTLPEYFWELSNPISGGFAFLSMQIWDMATQRGASAFSFCSEMCGDPATGANGRCHWHKRIQLQQLQTEHQCYQPQSPPV